jgi:hypothetical protein
MFDQAEEKPDKDKHSSLFVWIISEEEKDLTP